MAPPSSVKLVYFNGRGRAETCRWVLALNNVQYEDKRIPFEEWPALKPSTPTGMLPYAEIDGKMLGSSPAIAMYLSKQYGMMGANEWEEALIVSALDVIGDTLNAYIKFRFCKDEKLKEEYSKAYGDKSLPTLFNFVNKRLEGGKSWLVGDKVSLADVSLADFLDAHQAPSDATIQADPAVSALLKRVTDLPQIKAWIAKRPKTDF